MMLQYAKDHREKEELESKDHERKCETCGREFHTRQGKIMRKKQQETRQTKPGDEKRMVACPWRNCVKPHKNQIT